MNKLKDSYKTNNQNELLAHYDDWDTYEEDMAKSGYLGPIGCGALLNKYIHKDKKILEVGCGPGNIAKGLRMIGFKNIDGLDGSAGMVKRASDTKLYNNVYQHIVDKNYFPTKDFDILVAMGCFTISHFPTGTMKLCFDSIKGGGYFCFSITEKVKQTIFKNEFEYVKKNSSLIDFTEPYALAVSNQTSEKNTATVFLFRKNLI